MILYLLDTDIVSYLMKRRFVQLQNKFSQMSPELWAISSITYAELLFGLEAALWTTQRKNHHQPQQPISHSRRRVLAISATRPASPIALALPLLTHATTRRGVTARTRGAPEIGQTLIPSLPPGNRLE